MTAPPTDEDLMLALQRGDNSAYETLYQRWKDRIFRFLIRRAGSHEAAEEALQDTWMRIYRYRSTFKPGRKFSSWLYAIAVNAGHDARQVATEDFDMQNSAFTTRPEVRDYLVRALHTLPPDDRRILLLIIEGFESPEVAEMVGVSASAIRMRVKRARARIREELGKLDA